MVIPKIAIIGKGCLSNELAKHFFSLKIFGRPEVDLRDDAVVRDLADSLLSFDVIIFCAAINQGSAIEIMKVNLVSPCQIISDLVQKKYQGKIIVVGSHGASWTSWPGIDLDRLLYNNSKLALREFIKGVAQSGMCLASLIVFEPSKFKSSMNNFTGGEISKVVDRLVDIINDTSTDLLHVELH